MPPKKGPGAAKAKVASGRKQSTFTNLRIEPVEQESSSDDDDDDRDYTVVQKPNSIFPTLPRSQGLGDVMREAMMPANTDSQADEQTGPSGSQSRSAAAASSGTSVQSSTPGKQKSSSGSSQSQSTRGPSSQPISQQPKKKATKTAAGASNMTRIVAASSQATSNKQSTGRPEHFAATLSPILPVESQGISSQTSGRSTGRAHGSSAQGRSGAQRSSRRSVSSTKSPARPTHRRRIRYLKEIEKLQRTTHLLIPKLAFQRLAREICDKLSDRFQWSYRFTGQAMLTLQEAVETQVCEYFQALMFLVYNAGRKTLFAKDFVALACILDTLGVNLPVYRSNNRI